ncbi:MAG: hypothetical protein ACRETM_14170 [Stenotrophobium sp.]
MNKMMTGLVLAVGSCLMAGTALAADPAGQFQQVSGSVLVQRGMQTHQVEATGVLLQSGDSVITADTGQTLWRMADDTLFAMGPNSGIKIADFEAPNDSNSAGRANYVLIQGGFRTITGKIGSKVAAVGKLQGRLLDAGFRGARNPVYFRKLAATAASPYLFKTAMASLTTKGADYIAAIVPKLLAIKVNSGTLEVCNAGGCLSVGRGQYAVAKCPTCKPELVANDLSMPLIVAQLSILSMSPESPINIGVTVENPPIEPLPPPGKGCIPAVSPTANCVPSGPGGPVSPN